MKTLYQRDPYTIHLNTRVRRFKNKARVWLLSRGVWPFAFIYIIFVGFLNFKGAWMWKTGQVKIDNLISPRVEASDNIPVFPTAAPKLTSTPTPTPAPLSISVEEEIRWAFKDKGERVIQEAIKVARCESGLKETAYNGRNTDGSNDSGVFQVNSKAHGVPQKFLFNKKVNIAIARQLYDEQGWGPWYSSRKCHGLN